MSIPASGYIWVRKAIPFGMIDEIPLTSERSPNISKDLIDACTLAIEKYQPDAVPVRSILFNKSSTENWSLGWHQDRVICVQERIAVPGFSLWSKKSGAWHCEPPEEVLKRMIFAQIYLDDVTQEDGPTEILAGSHAFGKLKQNEIDKVRKTESLIPCLAKKGDVLVCNYLMLHRSTKSRSGKSRRILRIDFANFSLPSPLVWASV